MGEAGLRPTWSFSFSLSLRGARTPGSVIHVLCTLCTACTACTAPGAMELVAMELKAAGAYMARTLSYEVRACMRTCAPLLACAACLCV